ncbi:MAG: lipoprotein [Pasteurellaceae bacterium]|nr:lipoprotein [Pasteurellaceae bacterium]
MKKLLFIVLTAALALSACGVKGPLYFPEKTEQQTSK